MITVRNKHPAHMEELRHSCSRFTLSGTRTFGVLAVVYCFNHMLFINILFIVLILTTRLFCGAISAASVFQPPLSAFWGVGAFARVVLPG